jgi:nitrogen fixation/metabolism regulation signal transduction histidine kinase
LIIGALATALFRRERRRRHAEAALEQAYGEMERQVAVRTAELSDANRMLEEEIAERKRAEEFLKMNESEYRRLLAQFRTLLDTIPAPITLISPDMKVMWANKVASASSLPLSVSLHCYEARHDRSAPCAGCPAEKSFQTGKPENARMITPDGRHWDIRRSGRQGRARSGIIEASDITETVNLQAETCAPRTWRPSGARRRVAHEINNPSRIINCAEILFNKNGRDTGARDQRDHHQGGNRIAFIVKSSCPSPARNGGRMPSRLQEILADSIALTEAQMRKEGITLTLDVPVDLPPILAQPQQLVQVFLNLINNSRYALGQKYPGKHEEKVLSITAKEVTVDGRSRVRIGFRDRGTGIPANDVSRVIDPFFTTKPKGMGTGLGLSVSHGIILHHGGTLSIDSIEGEFTEVAIDLPVPEKR